MKTAHELADWLRDEAISLVDRAHAYPKNMDISFAELVAQAKGRLELAKLLVQSTTPAMVLAEWTPTHRHYKGGLYREISRPVIDASNDANKPYRHYVLYEDSTGKKFMRHDVEFDGWVKAPSRVFPNGQTGMRRFQPLPAPEPPIN